MQHFIQQVICSMYNYTIKRTYTNLNNINHCIIISTLAALFDRKLGVNNF